MRGARNQTRQARSRMRSSAVAHDEALTLSGVCDIVAHCARRAGLQDVRPHVLRHTFGKQALDAGEDLVTVATLMGHARLDTTAIYTQPNQRDLERAVEKLSSES